MSAKRLSPPFLKPILAAFAAASLVLVPAAYASTGAGSVVWSSPTKADNTHFALKTGGKVTLQLTASSSAPDATVAIGAVAGLPRGASINSSTGSVAKAVFSWTAGAAGEYVIRFGASNGSGRSAAPILTYVFDVAETSHVHYPRSYVLTNTRIANWAPVLRSVAVRAEPRDSARLMTTLATATPDGTQNLVLVLDGKDVGPAKTWYRVRLPILPNNSTGWVSAAALGDLTTVHTHVYVDRSKLTVTLKRDGRTVFTARIGVGKSGTPTPGGEFFVRDKLTNFANPFYGPIAFGTSARSAVLTDWPGGGFVGIHGTNEPGILPGQVSHGCIRLRNEDILKLARLMKIGTPLTIR